MTYANPEQPVLRTPSRSPTPCPRADRKVFTRFAADSVSEIAITYSKGFAHLSCGSKATRQVQPAWASALRADQSPHCTGPVQGHPSPTGYELRVKSSLLKP